MSAANAASAWTTWRAGRPLARRGTSPMSCVPSGGVASAWRIPLGSTGTSKRWPPFTVRRCDSTLPAVVKV